MSTKESDDRVTWYLNTFPRETFWASLRMGLIPVVFLAVFGILTPNTSIRVMLFGVAILLIMMFVANDLATHIREVAISSSGLLLRFGRRRPTLLLWGSVLSLDGPLHTKGTGVTYYIIKYRSERGKTVLRSFADDVGARVMEELDRIAPSRNGIRLV